MRDTRNEYWGWPFLDVCASHQTEKYGKLRFVDHPGFKSFFALDLPQESEGIALAARMGVKQAAVPSDYPESSRECAAAVGDTVTDLNIIAKSPERMELELKALAQGGSGILAVRGIDCLLRHPELHQVFSRYWRP